MTHAATDSLSLHTIRQKRVMTVARWLSILLILVALLVIVRALPIGQVTKVMKGWIGGLAIWGLVVLALATVAVTVYITWLARGKLQEQTKETTEEGNAPPNANVQPAKSETPSLRNTIMLAAVALVMAGAAFFQGDD